MLVYGHRSFTVAVPPFLHRFRGRVDRLPVRPSHDELIDLLIEFGEVESAVADCLQPEADSELTELVAWRSAMSAVADALCASWFADGPKVERAVAVFRTRVETLQQSPQPESVHARVAEGFAQYALYPEQYIEAAGQFRAAMRPTGAICVGLRSIGATLAYVVAAALERLGVETLVRTVRPRGHPWDRTLALAPDLRDTLADPRFSHVAVIDEGPGLSGSSFAATVDALVANGTAVDRIVLFPSWQAPTRALRSERARSTWDRHRKFVATFESTWLELRKLFGTAVQDISAGAWRSRVFGPDEDRWPPVQPQHERRKYLQGRPGTAATLFRFAGLARHGSAKFDRAQRLADAGFGPNPIELRHGFLAREWVDGTPLRSVSGEDVALRAAEYLAFVRRSFSTGRRATVADLGAMIRHNTAEDSERSSNGISRALLDQLVATAMTFDEPEIAVDGRMLPQEWVRSADRLVKVDAVDHHADDFLPGCRDIAWDVAGTVVEADFDAGSRELFVSEYIRRSGDTHTRLRLPFYTAAYSAYRLGYVSMAAETLGDESRDGRGFRQSASRYRRSLAALAPPPR